MFRAEFDGGVTDNVGYVLRDRDSVMSNITEVNTSILGSSITLASGSAATHFTVPSAVAFVDSASATVTNGQWLMATVAQDSSGHQDLVLAVTDNGGTNWPTVVSLYNLAFNAPNGEGAFSTYGNVVIAVDPKLTTYAAGASSYSGYSTTSAAGSYNNIYVYYSQFDQYTADMIYATWGFFVDSQNLIFPIGGSPALPLGNGPTGQCSLDSSSYFLNGYCHDPDFISVTVNLVVGNMPSCTGADQTFLFYGWAGVNPYGKTLAETCAAGPISQTWQNAVLFDPTYVYSGWSPSATFTTDNMERTCIGDQIDWPRMGLAFDPVNDTVAGVVSYYCPGSLSQCPTAGNRLTYAEIGLICPVDGGTGGVNPVPPTLLNNPNTCLPATGSTPCACDANNCANAPPSGFETDQILPDIAYNSNGDGTDNELTIVWYDNTGRGLSASSAISAFGNVLGRASADGSASHFPGSLEPGFGILEGFTQEVDATAVPNKRISVAPRNGSTLFYGSSHGSNKVFNQQWKTQ